MRHTVSIPSCSCSSHNKAAFAASVAYPRPCDFRVNIHPASWVLSNSAPRFRLNLKNPSSPTNVPVCRSRTTQCPKPRSAQCPTIRCRRAQTSSSVSGRSSTWATTSASDHIKYSASKSSSVGTVSRKRSVSRDTERQDVLQSAAGIISDEICCNKKIQTDQYRTGKRSGVDSRFGVCVGPTSGPSTRCTMLARLKLTRASRLLPHVRTNPVCDRIVLAATPSQRNRVRI